MPASLVTKKPNQQVAEIPRLTWRSLLVRAFLLLLPIGLFLLGFELRFRHLAPTHYAARKNLFLRQAPRINTLVLGSSHELDGILPERLGSNSFNLAFNSQDIFYDVFLLRRYLPLMPKLQMVVFPVSSFTFELSVERTTDRWRCHFYRYYYHAPIRDWHLALSARNYLAWFLCGSEISRSDVLRGKIKDPRIDYDPWGGWTNRPGRDQPVTADDLRRDSGRALLRHEAAMEPNEGPQNVAMLDQVITELRQRGVDVVFVTLPVSRFYNQGLDPKSYDRMQHCVKTLVNKHGLRYLNHMSDAHFTDADFQDADHLNLQGAARFSDILARDLSLNSGSRSAVAAH